MNTVPFASDPTNVVQRSLFEDGEAGVAAASAAEPLLLKGEPRIKAAIRNQRQFLDTSLDELVPQNSPVRAVWDMVVSADLSELYDRIQAVEGNVGRDAIDPRILMALWLFATVEGVSSAREIERLTKRDNCYRWICGGVSVNRTTLASFCTASPELLARVLIDYTAGLMGAGLVHLNRVSLDGTRVRASAGKSSFRRDETLAELQQQAEEQVTRLAGERTAGKTSQSEKSTQESAAEDRARRIAQARQLIPELAQIREKRKKGDGVNARVSTTDPDARTMKMANGGFNPAYNVQFATDNESGIIVGVEVNNLGGDKGLLTPMVEQIAENFGKVPQNLLADGGYMSYDDIEAAADKGVTIYVPVREEEQKQKKGIDPFQPLPGDSPALGEWRVRMGLEVSRELYKERAATAEWVNAQARNRNLQQFRVRGLPKVKCIGLWYALAHNFIRGLTLRLLPAPSPQ
jgi:transposase